MGKGMGQGRNGGQGSSTIDSADLATLLYIIEEEKMAGDLYEAFYEQTGNQVFANIAASEDRHYDAVLNQAEKLGLDVDEIVFLPAGEYASEEIQQMYDDLLAQGSLSEAAALEVGVIIEETDITDLKLAADGVEGTSLETVYNNLLDGSYNHLSAFEGLLA